MREAERGRRNRPACWIQLLVGRPDAWGPAAVSAAFAIILHDAVTAKTALLVIAIAALYWLGYSVNDYFDAASDAQDKHKVEDNVFVHCPRPRAIIAASTLMIQLGVLPIFGWFGLRGLVVFAVANFAMWAYSARPLRLKSRPGLDLSTHGLFVLTFPYLASLELIDAEWTMLDWIALGVAFFTSVAGQLRQQIRDFESDSRNEVNFTTTVGLETSLLALKLLSFLTFFVVLTLILVGLIPRVAVPLGILSLPAIVDRVTAGRTTRPPKRLYNLFSFAAAGYSILLICVSLFWSAGQGR